MIKISFSAIFFDVLGGQNRVLCYFCVTCKPLKEMKELFDMTRRERRGTIIVLALIALVLAVTVAARHWPTEPPVTVPQEQLKRFDAVTDSVPSSQAVRPDKERSRHHPADRKPVRKSGKKQDRKSDKKSPSSAPMDPVPQF